MSDLRMFKMPLGLKAIGTVGTTFATKAFQRTTSTTKPLEGTPHQNFAYDASVESLQKFLKDSTDHIIEELQDLTSKDVQPPDDAKIENMEIDESLLGVAAAKIIAQLGEGGIEQVGGGDWWQWRDEKRLRAEWLETTTHRKEREKNPEQAETLVLYLHGGAFYFGSPGTMRFQVKAWAKKMNARILTPHYRLAPQFPFPCAIQDCLAAYLFLTKEYPASRILLLGDSAGGNLCLSLLAIIRDQGMAMPAGAILLSPWVDLTHSFPSILADNSKDYIPKHGFRHKPSTAWPPPPVEDLENLSSRSDSNIPPKPSTLTEASKSNGSFVDLKSNGSNSIVTPAAPSLAGSSGGKPHPEHLVVKTDDGEEIVVKEQIHMYTTNSMIGHPLVSLVNQGSLGGLCPLLITSGGAEVLRDEHIYIAHKAANPEKYPPNPAIFEHYPRQREAFEKYKNNPTKVKLQVFDHCCHVVTALGFTRPARVMNRSIGTFAKWAIQHAKDGMDIDHGDEQSICSGGSDNSSLHPINCSKSAKSASEKTAEEGYYTTSIGSLLKVGETEKKKDGAKKKKGTHDEGAEVFPTERFENNMIRQRVNTINAQIYRLHPPSHFPCLSIPPSEIGTVKPGPLKFWLEGQAIADQKYGRLRKEMQQKQLKALLKNNQEDKLRDRGERPPPSSLYRRRYKDEIKPTVTHESAAPAEAWAWANSSLWSLKFWGQKGNGEGEDKMVSGSSNPSAASTA